MKPSGWIFMILSAAFITWLTFYSFWKIFTKDQKSK